MLLQLCLWNPMPTSDRKNWISTVVCSATLLLLGFVFVLQLEPAPRVGDGAEYYIMTFAWAEKLQPYADPEIDRLYDQYCYRHDSTFLNSAELHPFSSGLTTGQQRDFPHFWFYSLLAAPFYLLLNSIGCDIGYCFPLLHLTLFGWLLSVAGRHFGKRGLLIGTVICFASPVLWFFDKAHTEFFTVTVASIGILYFLKEKYAKSFVAFCLVSTQNPPFGIIALLVAGFGIKKDSATLKKSWPLLAVGIFIASLHPCYYFARFGQITPQLITGAASSSAKGWRELTCFLIDPDVGLFSNWPWLLIPLMCVVLFALLKYHPTNWWTVSFTILSLAILCWAQSKTNNFNHGGTVKISRYALWYIPFFVPLLLQFAANYRLVPIWQRGIVFVFLLGAVYVNSSKFNPQRSESYLYPTTIAENFYERLPHWYDPIPEIFIERCVRAELPSDAWAVSNRSGSKIIVHRGRLRKQQNWLKKGKSLEPISGIENNVQAEELVHYINGHVELPDEPVWFYVNRTDEN